MFSTAIASFLGPEPIFTMFIASLKPNTNVIQCLEQPLEPFSDVLPC